MQLKHNSQNSRTAVIQMLICAVLWSIAGIFIKLIDWNPFVIAGFRGLFAAAAVGVYMLVTKQKLVVTKNVLLSMFFLSATFLCFVSANKMTTAANAIVLQFTAPVFIVIFSAVFLKQRFRRSDILTVFLTLAGIAVFFLGSIDQGQMFGNVVAVFAGIFMTGMYIAVGRADEKEKMSGILFGHLLTALVGIPFAFFTEFSVTTVAAVSVVVLGIFQLGIPYVLLGLASKNCPPLACCLIGAVEPLLNPVWVLIFSGEMPGLYALVGGVIIITAVTLQCVLQSRREPEKAAPDIVPE